MSVPIRQYTHEPSGFSMLGYREHPCRVLRHLHAGSMLRCILPELDWVSEEYGNFAVIAWCDVKRAYLCETLSEARELLTDMDKVGCPDCVGLHQIVYVDVPNQKVYLPDEERCTFR